MVILNPQKNYIQWLDLDSRGPSLVGKRGDFNSFLNKCLPPHDQKIPVFTTKAESQKLNMQNKRIKNTYQHLPKGAVWTLRDGV